MAELIATVGALAGKAVAAVSAGGLGSALAVGGTVLSAGGAMAAGRAQRAASNFEAAQLEARAKSEIAVAQRDAARDRRQKELVQSRARAVGAASGGGVDLRLLSTIEEEGTYNELMARWEGSERARSSRLNADVARMEGRNEERAGRIKGFSTLLSGGASFMEQYG